MLQGEHSAILSTFIKLPFVIKIFVLWIFECPFYTGFTVWENLTVLLKMPCKTGFDFCLTIWLFDGIFGKIKSLFFLKKADDKKAYKITQHAQN